MEAILALGGHSPPSTTSARPVWSLRQDVPQHGIVLVLVDMMNSNVSTTTASACSAL